MNNSVKPYRHPPKSEGHKRAREVYEAAVLDKMLRAKQQNLKTAQADLEREVRKTKMVDVPTNELKVLKPGKLYDITPGYGVREVKVKKAPLPKFPKMK